MLARTLWLRPLPEDLNYHDALSAYTSTPQDLRGLDQQRKAIYYLRAWPHMSRSGKPQTVVEDHEGWVFGKGFAML